MVSYYQNHEIQQNQVQQTLCIHEIQQIQVLPIGEKQKKEILFIQTLVLLNAYHPSVANRAEKKKTKCN